MSDLHFGGSFNPIHHAHLICARAVAETCGYQRVVLLPAGQPPHKPDSQHMAPAEDRFAMCRLATSGSPLFSTSDIEIRQSKPSYTIDTVEQLAHSSQGPVHFLIGADMLLYLPKWHRLPELLQKVRFVVMARPGWSLDWQTLPAELRDLRQNVVEVPLIQISASDIRSRVARGLGIDFLTPAPVCDYIRQRGLYMTHP
jgi:nicotinate-nucleotide adenylyltransferase